jgi:transposase
MIDEFKAYFSCPAVHFEPIDRSSQKWYSTSMKQFDFMAEYSRLNRLSEIGDPLEKIAAAVNFEEFRTILDEARRKEGRGTGGRPPYDCVMMFKILLLQQWYGIADKNTEYLITDRLSFQRFLGLSLGNKVPDAKTIWFFRERIKKNGAERELFDLLDRKMGSLGIVARKGSITDAIFANAPRQRNSRKATVQS